MNPEATPSSVSSSECPHSATQAMLSELETVRRLGASNEAQRIKIEALEAAIAGHLAKIKRLQDINREQETRLESLKDSNITQESLIAELQHIEQHLEMLNKDLSAQNTALKATNHELESFSYAASHDLRGPLRGIHGFTLALARSAKDRLTPDEIGYVNRICSGAKRMEQLIDDLLQFSRSSRAEMKWSLVDLSALAREIADQFQEREPARQVLWQIEEGVRVKGDPVLLRVAMDNLLGNAWKYTSHRTDATIWFGRVSREGQMMFCVRDNGVGFDMTYAGKLFTPFQRLHSVRDFPGSGVGLASVARVIHRHGGTVAPESKVNEGAAFYFSLPEQATNPSPETQI